MNILRSRDDFLNFFKGKKIAILVFNKDSRNLLRFVNENLRVTSFEITYLIDLTLDYRSTIESMALKLINRDKIIRHSDQLTANLNKKNFDILLCFERRYGSSYMPKPVEDFKDCRKRLNDDYNKYFIQEGDKAEFNFRWQMDVIDYINWQADQEEISVVSAFWEDLFPYENPHIKEKTPCITNFVSVRILDLVQPLYNLKDELRNAKVRFILGSDWGVGKTSFLLEKMKSPNGSFGIAEDAWFALVSDYFVPTGLSFYSVKGYLVNEIYKCWSKDPSKDIYVKFGGRLEEYVYGIPTDQRLMLDDLPRYFKNSNFDIILKPGQTEGVIEATLDDLKRYYNLSDDRVNSCQMGYDGLEIQ